MTLAAPEHQEMNGQDEVTWRMLRTIAHSLMVNAIVSKAYIFFALMYTTDHIFPVLPIKYLINEDGDSTTLECTIRECATVRNVLQVTSTCPFIS